MIFKLVYARLKYRQGINICKFMKWKLRKFIRNLKCKIGIHYSWCTSFGPPRKVYCNNCKQPR